VLGFDRWVIRAAAYGSLLTPVYPPFQLDHGGTEPAVSEDAPAPTG
jgi:hypothetical protein